MKNKNKLRLSLVAAAAAAVLAGCATQSDTLGMTEDEATKTYAQAYDPARQMLMSGEFDKLHEELLKNVRKGVPRGTKMVQVILSDGFAPIRVEKTMKLELDQKNKVYAYVNYANAEPVATATAKARVKAGGRTTNMSSLTKMESLVLRDEEDRMPLRVTMFALALVKQIGAASFLGNLGTQLAAAVQHPDTRSWMTLPNQVQVARLVVPANQETISITTYDDKGAVLATENVKIAKRGPSVVYAVSYGKNLKAYANSFSWVN